MIDRTVDDVLLEQLRRDGIIGPFVVSDLATGVDIGVVRAENEDRVAALLEAGAAGELPALSAEDLGERAPGLASEVDSRFLQLRPDRDRTTGFFIARLKRDDG